MAIVLHSPMPFDTLPEVAYHKYFEWKLTLSLQLSICTDSS